LSEYDFEIKHIKGKENQVVYALNRRAHDMHVAATSMYRINLKDKIIEETNSDQCYLHIKEALQQGKLQQKFKDFKLQKDGVIIYRGKVYVPKFSGLKNTMMGEMHNVPYVGHLEYQKTIATVRSQYSWPVIKKEVANYIARCLECQKVKAEHKHPAGMLQPLPIPEQKW
jgi:hypothetical protein